MASRLTTAGDLARARLFHQQIAAGGATARTPAEIVGALGALQAQDYLGALWAVGLPGGNGMFLSTLVIDGRVAGTWKRTLKKKTVAVAVTPFAALRKKDRPALDLAAERYGRFLGLLVELETG